MSETFTIQIVVEGEDRGASSVLGKVGGSLQRVGEFVVGGLLVSGIQKVGQAFGNLAKGAVASVGNVQQLEKSLEGLLTQNLMYEEVTNKVTVANKLSEAGQQKLLKAQIKISDQTFKLMQLQEKGNDVTDRDRFNMQLLEKQIADTSNEIGRLTGAQSGYSTVTTKSIQKTKSYEEANRLAKVEVEGLLKFVDELSLKSPFEITQVEKVTQLALQARFATDEVKAFTASFLDFAAVQGIANIDFVAGQFFDLKTRGALLTADLRQLKGMGLDVARMIGIDMSDSVEEATERFGELSPEALKVFKGMDLDIKKFNATAKQSPEVIDAIFQKFILLSEEGSAGAAEAMTQTIPGMMSTAADIIEIGSRRLFRPILEAVGPVLAGALGKIMDFVKSPEIEQIGQAIGDTVAKGIEIFERFGNVIEAGGTPVQAFQIAISDMFPTDVEQKLLDISSGVGAFFGGLKEGESPLEALQSGLKEFVPPETMEKIDLVIEKLILLGDKISEFGEKAGKKFELAFQFISDHGETIINVLTAVGLVLATGAIVGGITAISTAALSLLPVVGTLILSLLSPLALLAAFVALVAVVWTEDFLGIRTALEPFFTWITDAILNMPETLQVWQENQERFNETMTLLWDAYKLAVEERWNALVLSASEKWEEINSAVTGKLEEMDAILTKKFDTIKTTIKLKLEEWKAAIRLRIAEFKTLGSDMMEGFKQGIINKAIEIIAAIESVIKDAVETGKALIGAKSPSTLTAEVLGQPMAEGVALGWMKGMPIVSGEIGSSLKESITQNQVNNQAFDQRQFGGDEFNVEINDREAGAMFTRLIDERSSQRLNASMGS